MSPSVTVLSAYHEQLLTGLRRYLDAVELTHVALVRQQLDREDEFAAASLCLLAGDSLGAPVERLLPAATALALLEGARDVFASLHEDEPTGLVADWGLPRALNAGDSFYALAQGALLDLRDAGLDDSTVLVAAALFDRACRAVSEELYDPAQPRRALVDAALALAACVAGTSLDSLNPDAKARLDAAVAEITHGGAA